MESLTLFSNLDSSDFHSFLNKSLLIFTSEEDAKRTCDKLESISFATRNFGGHSEDFEEYLSIKKRTLQRNLLCVIFVHRMLVIETDSLCME